RDWSSDVCSSDLVVVRGAIEQQAATRLPGKGNQPALQELYVGLGQIFILAGHQTDSFPEVLAALAGLALWPVVLRQAGGRIIGFTNIDLRAHRVVRVRANQKVDAGTAALLALDQLLQLAARPRECMTGPVNDFGGQQAVGRAVDQKEPDTASLFHTVSV